MSYSFTDSAEEDDDVSRQTVMVPFVDLLNHHSQHHAELRFHSSYLQLVAIRDIPQVTIDLERPSMIPVVAVVCKRYISCKLESF